MGFMSLAIYEIRNNVQLKDNGNTISKKKLYCGDAKSCRSPYWKKVRSNT
jgi:hypothetical protein